MKPNYTEIEFNSANPSTLLSCICYNCNKPFFAMKANIQQEIKQNRKRVKFCSLNCCNNYRLKQINLVCINCKKEFALTPSQIKGSKSTKSGNHFCSSSCAAIYNNTHKTTGYRRSKLEKYLEIKLKELYPNLEIHFNKKDTINSELDIYIPSLNLAFELNGIFHYEPIYGEKTLNKIQNNDNRKFQACIEKNIELCIIDTSHQTYVKESTSKKYLDIIINLINLKTKY